MIDYYKLHEPIGCRDLYTYNRLKELGLDVYVSGCITICLEPDPDVPRDPSLTCVSDVDNVDGQRVVHWDVTYAELPIPSRLDIARNVLRQYMSANKVYTTRLHAFLPCKAYGTDVELCCGHDSRMIGLVDVTNEQLQVYKTLIQSKMNEFVDRVTRELSTR